jgi:hypothetical protein
VTETTVRKFKGDRKLRAGVERMTRDGWRVQAQSTRRAWFSWLTGILTRKQIHTVTFARDRQS